MLRVSKVVRELDSKGYGIRSSQLSLWLFVTAAVEADTEMTAKGTWKTLQTQCSGAQALKLPEIKSWLLI